MIITLADKGGATVIWGIEEYLTEANGQLGKSEFHKELSLDPFIEYQKIVLDSLDELHKNNLIDEETVNILKPINAKPARFFLLPKYMRRTTLVDLLYPQSTAIPQSYQDT